VQKRTPSRLTNWHSTQIMLEIPVAQWGAQSGDMKLFLR